ncbi:MAG: acyl dehydratase [Rhodospirillaceae bacterium]|jgi:acyl dehydratase|nr:acyl dehydratase [Rhodospirillaceae bacterium]
MNIDEKMNGYLEDYEVGRTYILGEFSVDECEIIEFAEKFDPQPFHVNPIAAKGTQFGGVIASGYHVLSMAMRLLVDRFISPKSSIVSPGLDEIRWHQPTRPGDRLRCQVTVTSMRPSKSKPDRGILYDLVELHNQDGDLVLSYKSMGMYYRNPEVTVAVK